MVVFTSDNGPETPVTIEESQGDWNDPIRDRCFGTPGPWKGMKRFVFEGGHRVPGIIRWPGKIEPGSISGQLVNGTDWLPTVCAMAGVPVPKDRVIDGISILPLFAGHTLRREIPACWMFPCGTDYFYLPNMAMRDGSHTMIGWFDAENRKPGSQWIKSTKLVKFALYDLSRDTAQVHDLSRTDVSTYNRLRTRMKTLWGAIQSEAPMWKRRR